MSVDQIEICNSARDSRFSLLRCKSSYA